MEKMNVLPEPFILRSFTAIIKEEIQEFLIAASALEEPIPQLAMLVKDVFVKQQEFIAFGISVLPPEEVDTYSEKFLPVIEAIKVIQELQVNDDGCHLMICETIEALNWVFKENPANYVEEYMNKAESYGKLILKEKSDPVLISFIEGYKNVLKTLYEYIAKHDLLGFLYGSAIEPVWENSTEFILIRRTEIYQETLEINLWENTEMKFKKTFFDINITNSMKIDLVVTDVLNQIKVKGSKNVVLKAKSIRNIFIDLSKGIKIFLPKMNNTEIICSKSSDCVLCLLEPDETYVEFAMPEDGRIMNLDGRILSSLN